MRVSLILAIAIAVPAQLQRPRFEVASVKPGDSAPRFVDSANRAGGRYTATNETLKELIAEAWDVAGYHIAGGPGWCDSDRFTIEAHASADEKTPDIKLMLRSLLEDRFALRVHTENRPVVDRTGLDGRYDFTLNFTPGLSDNTALQLSPGTDAPSLFTALQDQIGLRLVSTKSAADILVIDRAEKPTPN